MNNIRLIGKKFYCINTLYSRPFCSDLKFKPVFKPLKTPPCEAESKAREELALCHRLLNWLNLSEGVETHVSYSLPCNTKFLIGAYGISWDNVTSSNLLMLDTDRNIIRGDRLPQLQGFNIHCNVHKVLNEKARVIIHTHQPKVLTLASMKHPYNKLLPINQLVGRFYRNIAYDDVYTGLADCDEEGLRIAEVFKNDPTKSISIMRNHGLTVIGETMAEALSDAFYLEKCAAIQIEALSSVGGDISKLDIMDHKLIDSVWKVYRPNHRFCSEKMIDGWRQTIMKMDPGYQL